MVVELSLLKIGSILLTVVMELSQHELEFTQIAVEKYQVLLVVYDPVNEVIVQWIK
jgi:hypothetical protein